MVYYITKQTSISDVFENCSVDSMLGYFINHKNIQVDTETTGHFDFKNEIFLLQLGDYENQFVINFKELLIEEKDEINSSIFLNPNICKVFQNAKFDIKFLWKHGFDIVNIYDTMLAEVLLNAGKDTPEGFYGLYSIVNRYCGVELDKETRGKLNQYGINTRVIQYAADDVKYLEKVKNNQHKKLIEIGLANEDCQDFYTICGLEMNVVLAFTAMEYNGIKLDVEKWKKIIVEVNIEIEKVIQEINDVVWSEPKLNRYRYVYQDLFTESLQTTTINWSSPIQKLRVLRHLFPDIENTAEKTLSKYKLKHPLISKLLKFNKINKLKTAFADKLLDNINLETGRVHTEFWQILNTGRVSSSNPNMQQIPSRTELGGKMRECFVAEKGYKMVGGDYSGCELRVIAEFSNDPVWVNAFNDGKDLHSELCAITFGIDIKDVKQPTPFKPDIKYRDVQKTLNFGLAYGMSEYKLADTIEISVDEARAIIKKFFKAVPKVEKFLNNLGEIGKKRGFIKSPPPYGRIRWFDGYDNKHDFKRLGEIERRSKNHPIQGGNADMTKLALVLVYKEIKENKYDVKLIHQVHDEIQTEANETFAEYWADIMSDIMIKAANVILKKVPMVVDCKVSDYWSK